MPKVPPSANQSRPTPADGPVPVFLLETEPWLRAFLRNFGDLFRPSPAPYLATSAPGEYWADALVRRPVAWSAIRKSVLGHALFMTCVFTASLLGLITQPHIVTDTPPASPTIASYQLTEYLPPVIPKTIRQKATPAVRPRAQKADPEFSPQEIITVYPDHKSTRQTVEQPSPVVLTRDTPLPNLVVMTAIPGAPMANNRLIFPAIPVSEPVVVPPSERAASRQMAAMQLVQQEAVAPAGAAASSHRLLPIAATDTPLVVAPAPESVARNMNGLQLPAQQPLQAVEPSTGVASSGHRMMRGLPSGTPQVVQPSATTAARNLRGSGLMATENPVAQPAQPVASGMGKKQAKEMGQIIALSARPVAPTGPLVVPEGSRKGEFIANPEGRPGASARIEATAGKHTTAARLSGDGGGMTGVYVAPPPKPVTAPAVVLRTAEPPHAPPTPRSGNPTGAKIEDVVFQGRKYYSLALNMPNLSSSSGSWIIRFAELNPVPGAESNLAAPVPITKVDPAYPAELMHDHVEGVVVLYALIQSDGHVGEARVLEGVEERLDSNSLSAIKQWRFRPATKNNVPVAVEAVIRVPFRVARATPY